MGNENEMVYTGAEAAKAVGPRFPHNAIMTNESLSQMDLMAKEYCSNRFARDIVLNETAPRVITVANLIMLTFAIIGILRELPCVDVQCVVNDSLELCLNCNGMFTSFLLLSAALASGLGWDLAIPAIIQTSTTYFWARQKLKRSPLHKPAIHKGIISDDDHYLFIYRLLACVSSLATLLLSTLPRIFIDLKAFKLYDNSTTFRATQQGLDIAVRTFSTYMIVAPFMLLFYNFYVSQVLKRPGLGILHIFPLITCVSIPISLLSLSLFLWRTFTFAQEEVAFFSLALIDFILLMSLPFTCIFIITILFLRYMKSGPFGILFEPVFFALLLFPEMITNLMAIVCKRHIITSISYSVFHIITHCFYHCSFSSTFLLAACRSIASQLSNERRRRRRLYSTDPQEDSTRGMEDDKERMKKAFIKNLMEQYSMAYRFRALEDGEREDSTTSCDNILGYTIPRMVEPTKTALKQVSVEEDDEEQFDPNLLSVEDKPVEKRRRTLEDVMLHYNILKASSFLKTPSHHPHDSRVGLPSIAPANAQQRNRNNQIAACLNKAAKPTGK
ncbi:hypothetical protein Ciccas_007882 [Cichlidogyrus casuarinus]|uniref:Uncharacterized protein n=1 Tax=Cichlidogyrus casuarinus TaxID=1844966 RepID=A0ABD2Q1K1_9PLAT